MRGGGVRRKIFLLVPLMLLLLPNFVYADKGPVVWDKGVRLRQEAQKAIIFHNSREEILILGTELKANRETDLLEFIPFPSEPKVRLAKGAPFEKMAGLIREKGLVFRTATITRGGGGGKATPVEIRLSEKIGLHEVAILKVNDVAQFRGWLDDFFKKRGIQADKENLSRVYANVEQYVRRGSDYFVFDRVRVSKNVKFVEPLVYRFRSSNVYYPLETSNLIGGRGVVELILVLPGSIPDRSCREITNTFPIGHGSDIRLSSSSKVYPGELEAIYGFEARPFFSGASRIYLQVLRYSGPYEFKHDFTYPPAKLTPYAYRYKQASIPSWLLHHGSGMDQVIKFIPPLTADEKRDMREAFCRGSSQENVLTAQKYGLDCWNFIPNVEYRVYAALFKSKALKGIPSAHVVLADKTVGKTCRWGKIDPALLEDFNRKNRVGYPLEHALPRDDRASVLLTGDAEARASKGQTSVSRVGFNPDETRAMVYVEHTTWPNKAVGYFVVLAKKNGEWRIVFSRRTYGQKRNR